VKLQAQTGAYRNVKRTGQFLVRLRPAAHGGTTRASAEVHKQTRLLVVNNILALNAQFRANVNIHMLPALNRSVIVLDIRTNSVANTEYLNATKQHLPCSGGLLLESRTHVPVDRP
jgi:hypothetical protein